MDVQRYPSVYRCDDYPDGFWMDLQAQVCEGRSGDLLRFPVPSVGADHDPDSLHRAGQAMELENAGSYRGYRADYGVQRRLCGYVGYGARRYAV